MTTFSNIQVILYVLDQDRSTKFYSELFRTKPSLNVPGMTEFTLAPNFKLGLMPNHGISKIIYPIMPDPNLGNGIPRCEVYLHVDDLQSLFEKATKLGAKCISEIEDRDWGDTVCYFADPDGHVLAFAQKTGVVY